jgi:DNA-binding NtrC family response regulator
MERAVHLAQGPYLTVDSLSISNPTATPVLTPSSQNLHVPLRDMVANYAQSVLAAFDGNKSRTAEALNISRTRLRRILIGKDN